MSDVDVSVVKSHPEYIAVVNELALKERQIAELERNFLLLKKQLFGPKSEKLPTLVAVDENGNPVQGSLFTPRPLPATVKQEQSVEVEIPAHKRRLRKRHTDADGHLSHFPAELERREVLVEPEGSKVCTACGRDKIELDRVVTERLQVIPCQYYVERIVRPVLGCNCKRCAPAKATSPESVLPKSTLGISFIALSLAHKFAWHLPFNRQSQMLKQQGLEISRDVLINTAIKAGELLGAVVREMANRIKGAPLVHMDETPCIVGIRGADGKIEYNRKAYFWPILAEGAVVFEYTGDRKHCNVPDILGLDYEGILMRDGYAAYEAYSKLNPDVILAMCWDHARRNFIKIEEDPLAQEALLRIRHFYKVEEEIKKELKADKLKVEQIPKYRKAHALEQLNQFRNWCEILLEQPTSLPKAKLTEAAAYVVNHWDGLTVYLEHGIVPISNIIVEQQIRNLKLGAKNWLFAASEVGAETVAIFNSLVCTCKMNQINIVNYLTDILGRLSKDSAKNLTPLAWAAEQEAKAKPDKSTTPI